MEINDDYDAGLTKSLQPKHNEETSRAMLFSFLSRYGIFDRCRELVEAGYDVQQPDKENVTLLHWAAINNRIDLSR